jgi:hypothetical protein
MVTNINVQITAGRPVFIYISLSGWTTANYQNAYNGNFTCHSITKTQMDLPTGTPPTANLGLFFAHPITKRSDDSGYPTDTAAASFIVRFYPSEISTFTLGTGYAYTFSITLSGTTSTYTGNLTFTSSGNASWSESTIPRGLTASSVPTVSVSSASASWSEVTIPHGLTATIKPTVVGSSAWSELTLPSCITAAIVPSVLTMEPNVFSLSQSVAMQMQ